jgi:hemolysin activation/secretion protein
MAFRSIEHGHPFRNKMNQAALWLAVASVTVALGGSSPVYAAQNEAERARPPVPVAPDAPVETPPAESPEAAPVAAEPATAPVVDQGPVFQIGAIRVRYGASSAELPTIGDVEKAVITLGKNGDTFISPQGAPEQVTLKLNELSQSEPRHFTAGAIQAVNAGIVRYFNKRGVIGVVATPDPEDLKAEGGAIVDSRPADDRSLDVIVYAGRVTEMRSVASGQRVKQETRINNPVHARVRDKSPVAPQPYAQAAGGTDLLRKDKLDEYVFRLNRHPGRRVDVAVSAAQAPGGIALDYLISEAKPVTLYAQVSNTGTESTDEWRERFGLLHTQLTGRNDILSLEYSTAGFTDSHALLASYELPILGLDTVRGRAYTSYSEFDSSEVGFINQEFSGQEFNFGLEAIVTVFQKDDFFVDFIAGGRYQHAEIDNAVGSETISGQTDIGYPYIGARAQRYADTSSFLATLNLIAGISTTSDATLDVFRIGADKHFQLVQGETNYALFLEPLINPARFRSGQGTLAHELAVSARGQYTFGDRLIPQNEEVAGGLYSVRGYEESVTAGDNVIIGSAEYRYHFPRSLPVQPDPNQTKLFGKPFRKSPQQAFGRPDWDLIFRGFVDVGRTVQTDRLVFERNNTLVGTGIGVEFQFMQNFTARMDWGVALRDVESVDEERTQAGDNRFHFVFTASY